MSPKIEYIFRVYIIPLVNKCALIATARVRMLIRMAPTAGLRRCRWAPVPRRQGYCYNVVPCPPEQVLHHVFVGACAEQNQSVAVARIAVNRDDIGGFVVTHVHDYLDAPRTQRLDWGESPRISAARASKTTSAPSTMTNTDRFQFAVERILGKCNTLFLYVVRTDDPDFFCRPTWPPRLSRSVPGSCWVHSGKI